MKEDLELDGDMEMVRRKAQDLMEHFDTVHIFCTRHNPGDDNTSTISHGRGNYFARRGQIQDWVIVQEEGTRMSAREDNS